MGRYLQPMIHSTTSPAVEINAQMNLAANYVHDTHRHVFLTGRAGTGKSTLLRRLVTETDKKAVVVAPTGVAAVNVGGHTIHSLFQLPFGVLKAGATVGRMRKLSNKKAHLLRTLDLLIIDEISMVRPDVLDAMDEVLRLYRQDERPFGGVQLLMIGDLNQLPPVLTGNDQSTFYAHYPTPYFFSSTALTDADYRIVELERVYRQSDPAFLRLLNATRNNRLDAAGLAALNARYRAGAGSEGERGSVVLTSHRRMAKRINQTALRRLTNAGYHFEAEIKGTFPQAMYPNELRLEFKVGAQVMFNKNDPDGNFYNGLVGEIVRFETVDEEQVIYVRCPGRDKLLAVGRATWEHNDPAKPAGQEKPLGTYTQHPLQLAWAMTIHKSQGLTFDRVVIDAADCFAHGQVYVALSRCRSLEGITLRSQLRPGSVRTDEAVSGYTRQGADRAGDAEDLQWSVWRCTLDCLRRLYDLSDLRRQADAFHVLLREHEASLPGQPARTWRAYGEAAINELLPTAEAALSYVDSLTPAALGRKNNEAIFKELTRHNEALAAALSEVANTVLRFSYTCRNQRSERRLAESYAAFKTTFRLKHFLLLAVESPFQPREHYRLRAEWRRRERMAPMADQRALENRQRRKGLKRGARVTHR